MIIYNPHDRRIIKERACEAGRLLDQIPARYCFVTGSFLHKEEYRDIDIFVISRSGKEFRVDNKKARITIIDFNDLYSLFCHSIMKSCIAKDMLPMRPLKVTMSDYWRVINEAVPAVLNQKQKYHKSVRFLVLYTEYFNSGEVLDTFQLDAKILEFRDYKDVLRYIKENVPATIGKRTKKSYIKRFFYTQAGYYRDVKEYPAQGFLRALAHSITQGVANG
ncbi:MAG: hypothetical protein KKD17_01520 [Nanoarchaeota archaeon]|nr:hypothetical protein [Nanoarchaeota archaeon]